MPKDKSGIRPTGAGISGGRYYRNGDKTVTEKEYLKQNKKPGKVQGSAPAAGKSEVNNDA